MSTHQQIDATIPVYHTERYVAAMENLVGVVQALSHVRDLESIMALVRTAARELTGADGATFVLRDDDKCYYADENAISPLWKGQRFPIKTCISGWVMLNAQPVTIEDIYKDDRIPIEAYRPTFVKSLAMVPIRAENPIGAIGNYWAQSHAPSHEDMQILQALAHVTAVAIENVELYGRLQEKLQALEKSNYELGSFAWAASHDLKTPLRNIDNIASWIEEDIESNQKETARQNIRSLRYRVRRMEKLLDDILEYAHVEHQIIHSDTEMADGRTIMEDITALVECPDGFMIVFSDSFSRISAPRLALQRIFCNLISNAIKHHDREKGTIEVTAEENETHYIFTVRDDGPGIPPQYREKIFEMFQTLKPRDVTEGSGMGLSLVKKILSFHGGSIALQSPSGCGSVFIVNWPKRFKPKAA